MVAWALVEGGRGLSVLERGREGRRRGTTHAKQAIEPKYRSFLRPTRSMMPIAMPTPMTCMTLAMPEKMSCFSRSSVGRARGCWSVFAGRPGPSSQTRLTSEGLEERPERRRAGVQIESACVGRGFGRRPSPRQDSRRVVDDGVDADQLLEALQADADDRPPPDLAAPAVGPAERLSLERLGLDAGVPELCREPLVLDCGSGAKRSASAGGRSFLFSRDGSTHHRRGWRSTRP
jgi:hypothetical protein